MRRAQGSLLWIISEGDTMEMVRHNDYNNDKYAKEFGIKITDELITVDARVLPPPALKYSESGREKSMHSWCGAVEHDREGCLRSSLRKHQVAERDATIQFMFGQVYAKLSQTPSMPTLLHMPTNIMQHRSFAPPLIDNNTSQGPINEEYLGSASTSTSKAMGEFTALLESQEQGEHGYANGYENFI